MCDVCESIDIKSSVDIYVLIQTRYGTHHNMSISLQIKILPNQNGKPSHHMSIPHGKPGAFPPPSISLLQSIWQLPPFSIQLSKLDLWSILRQNGSLCIGRHILGIMEYQYMTGRKVVYIVCIQQIQTFVELGNASQSYVVGIVLDSVRRMMFELCKVDNDIGCVLSFDTVLRARLICMFYWRLLCTLLQPWLLVLVHHVF